MPKKISIEKINESLLQKWDPIGIKNYPGAEDEYSQYAPVVYEIIINTDSYYELFEYLRKLETEYIGLEGNRAKTEAFANKLFHEIKAIS